MDIQLKHNENIELKQIDFSSLFDSFTFDCWAVNKEMVYIYQNDKSIENWGNVLGKSLNELDVCNNTKLIWSKQLKRVFNGEIISTEYAVEAQNTHFNSIITPMKNRGICVGAIGATIDITTYKKNEKQLVQRKKELERLNTALHVILEK